MKRSFAYVMLVLLFGSCRKDESSLFDPADAGLDAPVISSIIPANLAFAGVDTVTLNGTNFPTRAEDVIVYFDATAASILYSVSSTQIKVKAPNLVKDSVKIRVAKAGAQKLSNTYYFKLDAAFIEFPKVVGEQPWAATTDAAGNLYVQIQGSDSNVTRKYTPEGIASNYTSKVNAPSRVGDFKIGPHDSLYGTRPGAPGIYVVSSPGQQFPSARWVTISGSRINVFDFDVNLNIWAGGPSNNFVHCIRRDRVVKSFPLAASIRSVRVFSGYAYFAGKLTSDGSEQVFRFQIINPDSLGPVETYFNYSTSSYYASGRQIFAITFSSDGYMYLATDGPDPILLVAPDRSATPMFTGLMTPTYHSLAWGQGSYLYAVQGTASGGSINSSAKIFRINTLKSTAPYYGRQ